MVRKIELDALRSQLASVEHMERRAHEVGDGVGIQQFRQQREEIQQRVAEVEGNEDESASVAVFFGGNPVVGARGIDADFAGQVLDDMQNLVNTEFAAKESAGLGPRGPVRERKNSALMVTNVARGSFGFVLEEAERNRDMFASPLQPIVVETLSIIEGFASPDAERFEAVVAELEPRVLTAARRLFHTMDNARASMRIVSGNDDYSLSVLDVSRGRHRADEIVIDEQDGVPLDGLLIGLLPIHRRFEFRVTGTGEVISGKVANDVAKSVDQGVQNNLLNPIGKQWRAEFRIREVTARNAEPKRYYTLLRLLNELPFAADPPR